MREVLGNPIFWTVVGAFAATFSAGIAAIYTWLTFRLVRGQIEPNVVIYVCHDLTRPTMIQIVVENIGRGLASDVRFIASHRIPCRAFGLDESTADPANFMTHGPLINGIPTLGPGDSRRIDWGQPGGLKKALAGEKISITINYKHGKKEMPPVEAVLEVGSFEGTVANESEAARSLKALEKIGTAIEKLSETK